MIRRWFTLIAGLSLLLGLATCVFWVRGIVVHGPAGIDSLSLVGQHKYMLVSCAGRIYYVRWTRTDRHGQPIPGDPMFQHAMGAVSLTGGTASPSFGHHEQEYRTTYDRVAGKVSSVDAMRAWWVPHGLVVGILEILPLSWCVMSWRAVRRRRLQASRQLCPSCGYDLRATPRWCPECGLVPEAGGNL
jgi:hypothetical protein